MENEKKDLDELKDEINDTEKENREEAEKQEEEKPEEEVKQEEAENPEEDHKDEVENSDEIQENETQARDEDAEEEEFEIVKKGIGGEENSAGDDQSSKEQKEEEKEALDKAKEATKDDNYISQNVDKPKKETDPEEEKRESRKNRRVRNQVICYAALMVLLVIGGIAVAWTFENYTENQREAKKIADASLLQQQEALEQIAQNEGELLPPEETATPSPEPVETQEPEVSPSEEPSEPAETPNTVELISRPANPELDAYIDEMIANMPLEDKVAGLFIITPESLTKNNTVTKAAGGTKSALSKYAVGGLIYAKKNIKSDAQLSELLKNTNEYTKYPLFMMVQEEGGSISPLADAKLYTKQQSAEQIGKTGDPNNAYLAGTEIAGSLSKYGFNVDYLPIGDLANASASAMNGRVYGSDADSVIPYVEAMIKAMNEKDIEVCIGHFPGNGGVEATSSVAINNRSAEEFEAEEFRVLQAAINAGASMICISNVGVPAYTGDNTPAVFSEVIVTDIIRKQYGYDGLIISAPLNESFVKDYYDSDEAAIMALRAGCDMLLMPENFEKAYNGILEAVEQGTISEERINHALKRIYRVKLYHMIENGELQ